MSPIYEMRNQVGRALACLLLIVVTNGRLCASDWQIQLVDGGGGGKFTSLSVDKAGNAHAAYFNDTTHELRYVFWDQRLAKWFVMRVDDRCGGFPSMALDSEQRPHIAYIEYGTGRLKYSRWSAGSWKTQTIRLNARLIEYYTSIALDADDHPSIAFYEVLGINSAAFVLHLRTVRWTGEVWQVSTVDGNYGSGKFNSMVRAADGSFRVAYANVKDETASLRYARSTDKGWEFDIIKGVGTPERTYSVAMAVDNRDVPHITYTDAANRLVKYATLSDGKWQFHVIDSLAQEGFPDRNGITTDDAGNPYITYYDAGRGILKLAYRADGQWMAEIIDTDSAGFTSSIQVANGEILVVYYDSTSNSLKCARRRLDAKS